MNQKRLRNPCSTLFKLSRPRKSNISQTKSSFDRLVNELYFAAMYLVTLLHQSLIEAKFEETINYIINRLNLNVPFKTLNLFVSTKHYHSADVH